MAEGSGITVLSTVFELDRASQAVAHLIHRMNRARCLPRPINRPDWLYRAPLPRRGSNRELHAVVSNDTDTGPWFIGATSGAAECGQSGAGLRLGRAWPVMRREAVTSRG